MCTDCTTLNRPNNNQRPAEKAILRQYYTGAQSAFVFHRYTCVAFVSRPFAQHNSWMYTVYLFACTCGAALGLCSFGEGGDHDYGEGRPGRRHAG